MEWNIYLTVFFPLFLFGLGALVSIFSTDLRRGIVNFLTLYRYRQATKFNEKLDRRISRLTRLQTPSHAIGYIGGDILLGLLLITFTLLFAVTVILKVNPWISFTGFFGFWYFSIIFFAINVENAYQVSHGQVAIDQLEALRR
jgi:hypothetical protein